MLNPVITSIRESKVIAICRRIYNQNLLDLANALLAGRVNLIEVTFDQADKDCLTTTTNAIESIVLNTNGKMLVGAGTVLTTEQVDAAAKAGAKYIISPNTNEHIIQRTKELGLVSIPGAMTPSEIILAYDAGADFVKLFPAGSLGFDYIKDILAPITHVPLIATGGVNEGNFADYLNLGFAGTGVSGRLCDKSLIAAGDYKTITDRAATFMRIAKETDFKRKEK